MKLKCPVCITLAAMLIFVTGCSHTPDAISDSQQESSPSSSSASLSESVPADISEPVALPQEHYNSAEPWQRIYYDLLVQQLFNTDIGSEPSLEQKNSIQIDIYYFSNHLPMLSLTIGYHSQVWRIEDDHAAMIYTGDNWSRLISKKSRNPITSQYTSDQQSEYVVEYFEIVNNEPAPLYKTVTEQGLTTPDDHYAYTYADNQRWSFREWQEQEKWREFETSSASNMLYFSYSDFVDNLTLAHQRISDFFLDTYQPSVPDEAPAWVKDYIACLHNSFGFEYAYTPDIQQDLRQSSGTGKVPAQLNIFAPLPSNNTPFIGCNTIPHISIDRPIYYIQFDVGIHQLFPEWSTTYTLLKDAAGRPLVKYSDIEGWQNIWYGLGTDGKEELFTASFTSYYAFAYIDDEFLMLDDTNRYDSELWTDSKVPALLEKHGYEGEISEWSCQSFELPEYASWNELETILIGIMCDYAKSIGQWG